MNICNIEIEFKVLCFRCHINSKVITHLVGDLSLCLCQCWLYKTELLYDYVKELETTCFRRSCIYDSEEIQSIIIKYLLYYIKSLYTQKTKTSVLEEHWNIFLPYSAKCEYQKNFRAKGKPTGQASIHLKGKNHDKIKNFRKMVILSLKSKN